NIVGLTVHHSRLEGKNGRSIFAEYGSQRQTRVGVQDELKEIVTIDGVVSIMDGCNFTIATDGKWGLIHRAGIGEVRTNVASGDNNNITGISVLHFKTVGCAIYQGIAGEDISG